MADDIFRVEWKGVSMVGEEWENKCDSNGSKLNLGGASSLDSLQIRIYFEDDMADCILRTLSSSCGSYFDNWTHIKLLHLEASLQIRLLGAEHVEFNGK